MKGKRIITSLYIEPEVHAALKRLSAETRVPIAVYLREGVTDLLNKYNVRVTPPKKRSGEK